MTSEVLTKVDIGSLGEKLGFTVPSYSLIEGWKARLRRKVSGASVLQEGAGLGSLFYPNRRSLDQESVSGNFYCLIESD